MTDSNMTDQHPITPPPELVSDWRLAPEYTDGLCKTTMVTTTVDRLQHIATQAARWGADQELEACCEWVRSSMFIDFDGHEVLRTARRPKPPSLKKQALLVIDIAVADDRLSAVVADAIRRALEQLND
jgi:hypothetical protein